MSHVAIVVRFLLLVVGAVVLWIPVAATDPAIPPLTGRVVDAAGILTVTEERDIDRHLAMIEEKTSVQIVVATLPSLGRYSIESWGLALGRGWKIGRAGHDDGIVIVLAPNDREVRIEVGYGLEGSIPDAMAHRIIKAYMLPAARDRRFADGLKSTIDAVQRVIIDPDAKITPQGRAVEVGMFGIIILVGGIATFVTFVIALTRGFRSENELTDSDDRSQDDDSSFTFGSNGSGFSSGSSFSGGGGSFGGGGASGKW